MHATRSKQELNASAYEYKHGVARKKGRSEGRGRRERTGEKVDDARPSISPFTDRSREQAQ